MLGDTTGPCPSGFWFFLFLVEHAEQTKSASKQPDSGRKRRLTCCDVDRYVRENKTRNASSTAEAAKAFLMGFIDSVPGAATEERFQ